VAGARRRGPVPGRAAARVDGRGHGLRLTGSNLAS
jgi:hypothetical protein